MGFLEVILILLNQNAEVQQNSLLEKCNEHSDWLQNELQSIKSLIHQNPRDNFHSIINDENIIKDKNIEFIDEIPVPNEKSSMNGQKRKSSVSLRAGMVKDSPNQKRTSIGLNWEEVAIRVGLPIDLNKLKKEQLLFELENYGISNFSMKDLKKDMIDSLKEHLISKTRISSCSNTNVNLIEMSEDPLNNNMPNNSNVSSANGLAENPIKMEFNDNLNCDECNHDDIDIKDCNHENNEVTLGDVDTIPIPCPQHGNIIQESARDELETASGFSDGEVQVDEGNDRTSDDALIYCAVEISNLPENILLKHDQPISYLAINNISESTSVLPKPSPINSNMSSKPQVKNLTNSVTSFIPSNTLQAKVLPPKPIIPALEKARILREAEEAKEKAKSMRTVDDLKQRKINDSSNQNSIKPNTSTWDRMIKPISKFPSVPPPPQSNAMKPSSQTVTSTSKKGLMESIFGVKKNVTIAAEAQSHKSNTEDAVQISSTQKVDVQKIEPDVSSIQLQPLREIPHTALSPHNEAYDEYQIEDRDSSGSDESGTDDEEDRKEKQKKIPEWARGNMLKEALDRQYGLCGNKPMDPDVIFPEVQTCSLEEIFGKTMGKSGVYSKRSSSAHWEQDQLSLVEKRTYRVQMGYGF